MGYNGNNRTGQTGEQVNERTDERTMEQLKRLKYNAFVDIVGCRKNKM